MYHQLCATFMTEISRRSTQYIYCNSSIKI